MATIQGPGGAASMVGFNIKASAWVADLAFETVDTTGFGDDGYRVREATVASMDGTISGTAENSIPVPAAVLAAAFTPASLTATVTLTASSGNTYSFSGIANNVNFNRPTDGKMDMTLSFQSKGAITQSTWS